MTHQEQSSTPLTALKWRCACGRLNVGTTPCGSCGTLSPTQRDDAAIQARLDEAARQPIVIPDDVDRYPENERFEDFGASAEAIRLVSEHEERLRRISAVLVDQQWSAVVSAGNATGDLLTFIASLESRVLPPQEATISDEQVVRAIQVYYDWPEHKEICDAARAHYGVGAEWELGAEKGSVQDKVRLRAVLADFTRSRVPPSEAPEPAPTLPTDEQVAAWVKDLLYLADNFGIQGIEEQERVDRAEAIAAALPSLVERARRAPASGETA